MKLPVCEICRYVPVKCVICERRFESGELTGADFEVSRAIAAARCDIELKKAFKIGEIYVASIKGEINELVEQKLGKPLIIANSGQELLKNLNLSTRPSKVFIGGKEIERFALSRLQLENSGIDPNALANVLKYFGVEASII